MSSRVPEIHVREQTKQVLKQLESGELEQARQTVLDNKEILRYNFGLVNFVPLIPRIRFSKIIPRNHDALKVVIDAGFQIFSSEDDVNELLFFAAAKCDSEKLNYCVKKILEDDADGINQVRDGDTALMFLAKFGNMGHVNFPECVKILIDAGIDVNRNDYFQHNPLAFLFSLYKRSLERARKDEIFIKNLRESIQLLLDTKNIDASTVPEQELSKYFSGSIEPFTEEVQPGVQLFRLLIDGDEASFIKHQEVSKHLDATDGNNTLLQLCCEQNLKAAAKFLIKSGADLSKTTNRNHQTPLELAARRNHSEIFEAILSTNKVVIDEELFKTFLRNRPKHIKAKYFDEILKYKHLDMNIRSMNGNTPLHYAIIFLSTEAIGILLKRGASLTVENDAKKTPLDYISPEDLEVHLNKCVVPDSYHDINNGRYEVALNYRNLIEQDDDVYSELAVVEKICNNPKLCHLLNHPIISSFIDIKWKLVQPFYNKLFAFHLVFYALSILSFINLNLLSYLGFVLAVVYSSRIALLSNWDNNKLHEIVDATISFILIMSVVVYSNAIKHQLGIVATIFMALSLHLFWRFHPDFSTLHVTLINIISHIFSYLSYIFMLTLFFGSASYIFVLIQNDDENVNSFFTNVNVLLSHFYLLCAFGTFFSMIVIMTLIQSVSYLQHNSGNLQSNFEILGHKNVFIFLRSVEKLHHKWGLFKNSLIFDEQCFKQDEEKVDDQVKEKKKQKKLVKNKNRFLVNFYVNLNKFSFEKLVTVKLTDPNVDRIKKIVSR